MKPIASQPRWLSARIGGARRQVLGFVTNRQISTYVGRLPPEETAEMIATGCGYRVHVRNACSITVLKLEEHGICDRDLWRLQALVAERLAAMKVAIP